MDSFVELNAETGTGDRMIQRDSLSIDPSPVRTDSLRRVMSREFLVTRLTRIGDNPKLATSFGLLTEYCGASAYLVARYDMVTEQRLDSVLSSNWPFDLVRQIDADLHAAYHRTNEFEKCLAALQPAFAFLPDDVSTPEGVSRQYCSILFNAGRSRYILLFLLPEHTAHSAHRIMEAALFAGYILSTRSNNRAQIEREMDLTERELECIYWIAEGKTSDEIAMILGISRNTINNYITSVMRKTATKNRSEAIAYAVRNNLV